MGCRLEIYTHPDAAAHMLSVARHWGVDARIIGRVEAADTRSLRILKDGIRLEYGNQH
jgi:phosphoribosylformylglycinamidine cyclo-ligase